MAAPPDPRTTGGVWRARLFSEALSLRAVRGEGWLVAPDGIWFAASKAWYEIGSLPAVCLGIQVNTQCDRGGYRR
jgi:hypothetical protein